MNKIFTRLLPVVALGSVAFGAYAQESEGEAPAITKKVLIEEFTTMMCGNCPAAASNLNSFLHNAQYQDMAVAVCHHSGYYTDVLTQPCDEEFLWFYPGSSTYAPAMMFDRAPLFKYNGEPSVIETVTLARIKASVTKQLEVPAQVAIDIKGDYDRINAKLTVVVTGRGENVTIANPALTVYLTENDVKTNSAQAGGGTSYKHQHVIRAYNSTWGTPVTFEDGMFTEELTFTIDPTWNRDNMHIVALVSNDNTKDNTDCVVDNVEEVAFPVTNGTDMTDADAKTVSTRYYTMEGTEISSPAEYSGVAVCVRTDAAGRRTVTKTICK